VDPPDDREHAPAPWELGLAGESFIGDPRPRLIGCRWDSCARSQSPELACEDVHYGGYGQFLDAVLRAASRTQPGRQRLRSCKRALSAGWPTVSVVLVMG
jgi:hypothetical protein